MILTRARTLLRPCFARLLAALVGEPDGFAAGAFHARPLRRRSKSRRARKRALERQSALRPLRFAPTIVRRGDCLAAEKHMPPKHPLRSRAITLFDAMLTRTDTIRSCHSESRQIRRKLYFAKISPLHRGRFCGIINMFREGGAVAQRGEIQCAERQFALQSGRLTKCRKFQ